MLERLTFETVKELQGTSFWVYPEPDHKVELRLVAAAKVMESEAARLPRTPFSAYFLGPPSYALTQGAFPMTHAQFPEPFFLFIVPVESTPDGLLYEAVFT